MKKIYWIISLLILILIIVSLIFKPFCGFKTTGSMFPVGDGCNSCVCGGFLGLNSVCTMMECLLEHNTIKEMPDFSKKNVIVTLKSIELPQGEMKVSSGGIKNINPNKTHFLIDIYCEDSSGEKIEQIDLKYQQELNLNTSANILIPFLLRSTNETPKGIYACTFEVVDYESDGFSLKII